MSLIDFTLTTAKIEPDLLLSSLESVIPKVKIEQAIRESNAEQTRTRSLPTYIVISLIIAMSFWAKDSIVDVFKNLIVGLNANFIVQQIRLKIPRSSEISEARQRVGPRVLTRLFELIAKPLATIETPGAFLNGLRLMAIDGTVFDVPDTANVCSSFWLSRLKKRNQSRISKS